MAEMRDLMPETAAHVDRQRKQWGAEWVNRCITEGHKHKRHGWFYAVERGHVLGTPFTNDQATHDLLMRGVVTGSGYVCALRPPSQAPG